MVASNHLNINIKLMTSFDNILDFPMTENFMHSPITMKGYKDKNKNVMKNSIFESAITLQKVGTSS